MPRRHRPDPEPAELEAAFVRNIAWLRRHGRRLPRHLCQIGHLLAPCSFRDAQAEIGRWIAAGDLVEDARGDYRLTKAGEARLSAALSPLPCQGRPDSP